MHDSAVTERWAYGRHEIFTEKRYFATDDGTPAMDVELTIDGWEKYYFPNVSLEKSHVGMISGVFRMLDQWDKSHPIERIFVS